MQMHLKSKGQHQANPSPKQVERERENAMFNFIFCSLWISRDTGYIGFMVTWKNSCLYHCESFAGDLPYPPVD